MARRRLLNDRQQPVGLCAPASRHAAAAGTSHALSGSCVELDSF